MYSKGFWLPDLGFLKSNGHSPAATWKIWKHNRKKRRPLGSKKSKEAGEDD